MVRVMVGARDRFMVRLRVCVRVRATVRVWVRVRFRVKVMVITDFSFFQSLFYDF